MGHDVIRAPKALPMRPPRSVQRSDYIDSADDAPCLVLAGGGPWVHSPGSGASQGAGRSRRKGKCQLHGLLLGPLPCTPPTPTPATILLESLHPTHQQVLPCSPVSHGGLQICHYRGLPAPCALPDWVSPPAAPTLSTLSPNSLVSALRRALETPAVAHSPLCASSLDSGRTQ